MNNYDPFDTMTFTYDKCFLCGTPLNVGNYTQEHIYPKWLQRQFDLWNKDLILLNGSKIKYKSLKIPCCNKCNKILSKEIEKPIKEAVKRGYDEFKNLDNDIIFKWLNKLSYAMLFKELSLRIDVSNNIYTPEMLKEHKMQFTFLKSTISKAEYINKPYSVLIFKIKQNEQFPYWASDNTFNKTFFMILNDIGIIAHLMDNGSQKDFFMEHKDMSELLTKELHRIQFYELCAKFSYKAELFYRNPAYIITMDKDEKNINSIISHNISGYMYDDWIQETYAKYLAHFLKPWGIKFSDIYVDDEHVMSWLRNEDMSFKEILDD
ncbi:MAG: hypothetical protein ACERKZ_02370 [Lachnotalea sp.]